MIFLLSVIALAVLVGLVAGGRLTRFMQLELRWWLLAPVALALQEAPLPDGDSGIDLTIRMVVFGTSYAMLLIFSIRNRRIAGVPVIVIGLLLNGLVVTLNGSMPVSESAVRSSDESETLTLLLDDREDKHDLMTEDTLLPFLGDVVAIGAPIDQVISVGDVFVYAGIVWLVLAVMRGRTAGLDRPREPVRYRGRHRRRTRPRRAVAPARRLIKTPEADRLWRGLVLALGRLGETAEISGEELLRLAHEEIPA